MIPKKCLEMVINQISFKSNVKQTLSGFDKILNKGIWILNSRMRMREDYFTVNNVAIHLFKEWLMTESVSIGLSLSS